MDFSLQGGEQASYLEVGAVTYGLAGEGGPQSGRGVHHELAVYVGC